ncbi:MAG: hypothetical protein F2660_00070 [Actinobacteria bacterium]|uniref:Unannotated protein n=1 Tax=freshwater metagenome TaxID=449393 RepID=A0A6J6MUT5_9ZZZZ|nr:hypothetical protein [Actinomycetota bacterium]
MNSGRPIRVVFLSFYFEAWDALADIYRQMLADPRFEPTVISIPRRLTGETTYSGEDKVSALYDSVGVEHLRFDFEDSAIGLAKLREIAPDYVFLNYPWQRNYQPNYRAEVLSEFTKVCQVPYYSFALVNEPGEDGVAPYLYTQRSHQLSSLIFTQDAAVVEAYSRTSRGNSHVHLTGSPKLDSLVSRAIATPRDRYTLVWAPHHSYSAHWLNFGTFASMYREMLDFAKSHQDIEIIMRPHPFMFGTLVDRQVVDESELNQWLEEFKALPNTSIETGGDFASLFLSSDLLLTDGISFIGEYPMITGKPAVYLENSERWKFSPIGEIAVQANWRIGSFAEFADRFDQIRAEGLGDYSAAIERLRKAASPYPGESAARIIEIVAGDFAAETPLVDKSTIKEVAWELGPDKEPLVD